MSKYQDFYEGKREEFDRLLKEAYDKARKLTSKHPDDKSWKPFTEENGFKVTSKEIEGSNFKVFQGMIEVKTNRKIEEIAEHIHKILTKDTEELENIYDRTMGEMVDEMKIVYNDGKYFAVEYTKMKSPSRMVYPRDLLVVRNFFFEEDSCSVIATSIPKEMVETEKRNKRTGNEITYPSGKGFVRATMFLNCLKIKKVKDSNIVIFQTVSHICPGGWIPPLLFNFLAGHGSKSVKRMVEEMEEFLEGQR